MMMKMMMLEMMGFHDRNVDIFAVYHGIAGCLDSVVFIAVAID